MYAMVIGIIMLGSVWYGGAPLHQLLDWHEAVFYGIVFLGAYFVLRWLLVMRQSLLALLMLMALSALCIMAGGSYRYVNTDMAEIVMTKNIPVSIKYNRAFGKLDGYITVTNEDPINNLVRANIICKMFYDNGKMIDKDFVTGVGGPNVFTPGDSYRAKAYERYELDNYRADAEKVVCRVTRAVFNKPLVSLSLRWEQNVDGREDFFVTNNGTVSVKNVQFSCADTKGNIQKVTAYPSYTKANVDTIIYPGSTAKFTSDTKWFTYTHCIVMNALEI